MIQFYLTRQLLLSFSLFQTKLCIFSNSLIDRNLILVCPRAWNFVLQPKCGLFFVHFYHEFLNFFTYLLIFIAIVIESNIYDGTHTKWTICFFFAYRKLPIKSIVHCLLFSTTHNSNKQSVMVWQSDCNSIYP